MSYRSSSSQSTTVGGSTTTPFVPVPSGVQAGDIVILVCSADNVSVTIPQGSFPTGFTRLGGVSNTLDGHYTAFGYKRLTGADAGNYTFFSIGASSECLTQAFAFSGRHTTNNPVASANSVSNASNANPVTVTAATITALAGDDLLWIGNGDVNAANIGNGFTPPSGYTERQDAESLPGWCDLTGATKENVSAGATGTVSGTLALTSGAAGWSAWQVRIPSSVVAPKSGFFGLM